ncbi:hypothetical protein [Breoghania sp.]|uniref:hypothetical protein n=1 Tax=Breoghania sp. TaxID=2065378 RepID=UPI00260E3BB5|nr:hypothetical protein [Breoghania sp.]MDJ0933381.1 hypothetical protein [Breoghania sp.]
MKRLANSLSVSIIDKVLSQDTPLREKFIEEVPSSRLQRRTQNRRARSRVGVARQRFQDVKSAADREVNGMFSEAREWTERTVQEIREAVVRSKVRQAEIRFISGRSHVEDMCNKMLKRCTDQVVLISQEATASKIAEVIDAAERGSSSSKRLMIQTSGVNSAAKTRSLRAGVDRVRGLNALKDPRKFARTGVHMQYVNRFDVFVDASLLIRDGTEILFAASSLLMAGNSPQTAFHVELLAPRSRSMRSRYTTGNAAKEMLSHVAPTCVLPSPTLDVRATRRAPDHPALQLETHLEMLLKQLGDEVSALERDGIGWHRETSDARNLARMIAAELEEIERLLEIYERETPLTAEVLQDEEIIAETASMIARTRRQTDHHRFASHRTYRLAFQGIPCGSARKRADHIPAANLLVATK